MKKTYHWSALSKSLFRLALKYRTFFRPQKCEAFGETKKLNSPKIGQIYVINLERQPGRLAEIKRELNNLTDYAGNKLSSYLKKYNAIDATSILPSNTKDVEVDPIYTLADQLFVEPQPLAFPTRMDLNSPVQMSLPEIAIAKSHIDIWRTVAVGNHDYVLILEDDVWFIPTFSKILNQTWLELIDKNASENLFDILYLSYEEVKGGAPKIQLSKNVYRPERGIWNLSGYIISRKGADNLLKLLPCRGPVDLWLNHQFKSLEVRVLNRSIINQRPDLNSTNSYSILPSLTKIGALNSESASLFQIRPQEHPVFAFGPADSGLTSIAMALSMLGYRCCSDIDSLPNKELEALISGNGIRIFDAYVNVGSLHSQIGTLKKNFPHAKIIFTEIQPSVMEYGELQDVDFIVVRIDAVNKWQLLCEYLKSAPPLCPFPEMVDVNQRENISKINVTNINFPCEIPKRDESPWLIESRQSWQGIYAKPLAVKSIMKETMLELDDNLEIVNEEHWFLRADTFTDNLALFRPNNLELHKGLGAALVIEKENLGVREYSSASITSKDTFLYGSYEATIKASKTSGVVTGFFLHRDSPRQEIDIEITGNRTDRLIVNVFYNPGRDGDKFDYGYRGSPTYIDLGFDASQDYHKYKIEWMQNEICWFVDDRLVHRRVEWDPTPIPHLPMSLHVNIWPCRSKELAGRLDHKQFPTKTFLKLLKIHPKNKV